MDCAAFTANMLWIKKAAKLRGKSLATALALLEQAGCQLDKEICAQQYVFGRWALNRYTARRGLKALEAAGLVEVARHVGRRPFVKIINSNPTVGEPNGTTT